MPLFILTCTDKTNSLNLRVSTRVQHLDYLAGFPSQVRLAGPLLADVDGPPIGSLLVLEMASYEDAAQFAANDPYAQAGLFEHVAITPSRATIGSV